MPRKPRNGLPLDARSRPAIYLVAVSGWAKPEDRVSRDGDVLRAILEQRMRLSPADARPPLGCDTSISDVDERTTPSMGTADLDPVDLDRLETIDDLDVVAAGATLESGARVAGKYVVTRLLGTGGMGAVYLARDERLARDVAIKIALVGGRSALERAEREAKALAKLSDPNVVVIYEVGEHGGRLVVAMEYLTSTARAWLAAAPRTWREIVALYASAGAGLAAAHAAGIVHRDFKPDNVLVGDDGRARVADFGLARAPDGATATASAASNVATATERLTRAGSTPGTPAYMAPEQLAGGELDARADQFAFCVTLWEALYRARPFAGKTPDELLAAMAVAVPAARRSPVPRRIADALRRGLSRDPGARWPSMRALLAQLRIDRPRLGLALAGGALIAGVAIAAVGWLHGAADPSAACDAAASRVAAARSPLTAGAVKSAFASTGRNHAAATADLVRDDLERYADRWATMRRDVCLASSVRAELPAPAAALRVTCLDRLADQLGALTTVFERDADAAVVDGAVKAIGALPPPSECAAPAEIPAPTAAQASAVAELRAAHDAIAAGVRAGRYQPLLAAARANAAAAVALGYAPLATDAVETLADLEDALHDGDARRAFRQLIDLASAAHNDRAIAAGWRGLVRDSVAHTQLDAAREQLAFARAAAQRGSTPDLATEVDSEDASLRVAAGDYPGALVASDRVVAATSLTDDQRAAGLVQRGEVLTKLNREPEGIAAMRQALALWERELGPTHPKIARTLRSIGRNEAIMLQNGPAEADLDRSAALTEAAFGADSLDLAQVLTIRCGVRYELGKHADATADCDRALAIELRVLGPDSIELVPTLDNAAKLAAARDDTKAMIELRQRVVAIHERALGPMHPDLMNDYYNLAAAYEDALQFPRSHAATVRGLAIARAVDDTVGVATGLTNLAGDEMDAGQLDAARVTIRDAIAHQEALAAAPGASPEVISNVGHVHAVAGLIEYNAKRYDAAEVELQRAVEKMEPIASPRELVQPLEQLGETMLLANHAARAIPVLERADRMLTALSGQLLERGNTRLDLAQARWAVGDRAGALAAGQAAVDVLAPAPDGPQITDLRKAAQAWLADHVKTH